MLRLIICGVVKSSGNRTLFQQCNQKEQITLAYECAVTDVHHDETQRVSFCHFLASLCIFEKVLNPIFPIKNAKGALILPPPTLHAKKQTNSDCNRKNCYYEDLSVQRIFLKNFPGSTNESGGKISKLPLHQLKSMNHQVGNTRKIAKGAALESYKCRA